MTLAAGTPSANNLLGDFRTQMGINAGPLGATIGGGWLHWAFVPAADVTTVEVCRAGIIVVDENTGAEVPSPAGDEHVDWMWYQAAFTTPPRRAIIFDGSSSPMLRWRASRRMDEIGMNLYLVFEATVAGDLEFDVSTVVINP